MAKQAAAFDYDKAFQFKILRTLYQDPDYTVTVANHLQHSSFDSRYHRWLAEQILDYARKHGHGIDLSALAIKAKRSAKIGKLQPEHVNRVLRIAKLLHKPVRNKTFVKEELFNFIEHQTIKDAMFDVIPLIRKHEFDEIKKRLSKVVAVRWASTGGLGMSYVKDVNKRIELRKENERGGLPTGTALDDHLTPGGLPKRKVGCILAPSGKGKSHCLVHFGASTILESPRQERVLHISLDNMSETEVGSRYDAWFNNSPINLLSKRKNKIKSTTKKLGSKYGDFLRIKEFTMRSVGVSDIKSFIRQLESVKFYPTLVIIDYAGLLRDERAGRADDKYIQLANIMEDLMALANELNIAIWTVAQAKRSSLNKEVIDIDDFGDSWAAVQPLPLIVSLSQTTAEEQRDRARLVIIKSKFGPQMVSCKVIVNWARSKLRSIG